MTSLIITIYKSPVFLKMVLESVLRQIHKPDEVIITEDGELPENNAVIKSFSSRASFPIIHIVQRDQGNRKPLALNKAIQKSKGDYLIFLDGDCVIRNDFIQDHLNNKEEQAFLAGRRVELSQKASLYLNQEKISQGYLDRLPLFLYWDSLFGETHHLGRMIKTPSFLIPLTKRAEVADIRGCNFSVHKKNLVAINGFSNDFSGAYGEDSDVEYRLKFLGLKMKSLRGSAIQFHLWHPTQTKDLTNQTRLEKVLSSKNPYTSNGLKEAPLIE